MASTYEMACRVIDSAGQAGGIDEVRRLAEHGWPDDRGLDGDSPELRAAIQDRARAIVADAGEAWTYEGYWNTVLGASRDAAGVVREFGLGLRGIDEWLGQAEATAWVEGGGKLSQMPTEWADHHAKALAELTESAGQTTEVQS